MDEVLAIAALMVSKGDAPEKISRVNSEEAMEMVRAGSIPQDCWVIDCGLEYDPERLLFDHHQDRDLPSAALMVFRHLFPELMNGDLGAYFELVSKVDTGGLRSLDDFESLGESRDYMAFPQQILTGVFENDPRVVLTIVAKGLEHKIHFEEVKKAAAEWVEVPGRLVDLEVGGVKVLEYTEQPPIEIVDGLKGIDRTIIEEHGAAVVYGFDKKDAGIRTLYRTDVGHDLVDFTRAKFTNELFCHQGGFLARFRPADREEWKRLIAESVL